MILILWHVCILGTLCVLLQVKKTPPPEPSSNPNSAEQPTEEGSDGGEGKIASGKLRGEDYNFEFQGKVKEGKMHFRLFMTQVGGQSVWSSPQECGWWA